MRRVSEVSICGCVYAGECMRVSVCGRVYAVEESSTLWPIV